MQGRVPVTRTAVRKPPCVCGHEAFQHQEREDFGEGTVVWHESKCQAPSPYINTTKDEVWLCDCLRYQRPGSPTKRQARKNYHRGSGYENDTADAFHGLRMGRVGNADVIVFDPAGGGAELLALECEETKTAALPKARIKKHDQAVRLAKGRKGAPLPAYVFRRKLGPGKQSESWVLMTRTDMVTLLERLGAFGE